MIDVAIVGASFAGLACAKAAAARGLSTVVLERKRDVGAAPHTTGLLVREVADAWDVPRALVRRVPGVRLYAPSLAWVDLESPGYYFLATDVPDLLRWLADDSRAEIRTGVTWDGGRAGARWLVGADGPRSRVARAFGLGVNRDFLVGAEWEFEGVGGVDPERLHVFLDPRLAPGYIAWVVPGVRATQVGLAGRIAPRVDAFIERVSRFFDFTRARVVGRRGGLIPVGGPVRPFFAVLADAGGPAKASEGKPFARGGVVLVGDAAGLVSPLTGGGIHTALESGRAAGGAIGTGALPSRPTFFWKRMLRRAMDVRWPAALFDVAIGTRPLRALAQAVFFHHRGLFSPAAWRDIVLAVAR
jgi:flavin-dependent dehydrogenase